MSLSILLELRSEVRRLFIAGSGLAAGDLRLQKLLPSLQKLGEGSPIFNRMAQAVAQLLEADTVHSAGKLLELSTLLHAVLYTQGLTETQEELHPLEGTASGLATPYSYRKLQPLLEALTEKGQGRLELLRQAHEHRLFDDFRVIPAAVAGLDDSYSEIAELLHDKVIPEYGMEALPSLTRQFKLDGGKGHARRLELIHSLLQASYIEPLLQAATEGSVDVRSKAIELLGQYPEQEQFLVEQADDKKKEIRQAALFALARLGTQPAMNRLFRALTSKDRELAVEPIQRYPSVDLIHQIVGSSELLLDQIVQKSNVEQSAQQLLANLNSLQEARTPEVFALLKSLLSTPAFIQPETEKAQELAAELLKWMRTPESNQFLIGLHHTYDRKFIEYSFIAALRTVSPAQLYDLYSPDLRDKNDPAAKQLLRVFQINTSPLGQRLLEDSDTLAEDRFTWDPRWAALFVKLDVEELVNRMANRSDPTIISYLVTKCKEKPDFNDQRRAESLLALFHIGYKEAPGLVMEVLESGNNKRLYGLDKVQLALIALLPKSFVPRLQSFSETIVYNSVKNQVIELCEEMKTKPEEAEQPEQSEQSEKKGLGLWQWIRSKTR